MEMVNERCPNKLTDIDYADDICILCQSAGDMQDKLTTLAEEGQKARLKINTNKTEVMKINCKKKNEISVGNEPPRKTDSVCYLGSVITTDEGLEVDIRNRLNTAQAAFTTLKPVWDSTKFKTMTKLRIFNSNVKSVPLYACESWLVSKQVTDLLQTCCESMPPTHPQNLLTSSHLKSTTMADNATGTDRTGDQATQVEMVGTHTSKATN
jgi:hypothetical protein